MCTRVYPRLIKTASGNVHLECVCTLAIRGGVTLMMRSVGMEFDGQTGVADQINSTALWPCVIVDN